MGIDDKDGTVQDFTSFATQNTPQLLRFAAVLTNDNGVAEDVVQDVLIKAQRRWALVSASDHPHAYVRRMIVNELGSWRRKWARYVPSPDARLDRRVDDGTRQVDDRSELTFELAKLPPQQRAAVTLRYLEDLTDQEIADVLGCSPVTVRGYIHRALLALRVELTPAPLTPMHLGKDT